MGFRMFFAGGWFFEREGVDYFLLFKQKVAGLLKLHCNVKLHYCSKITIKQRTLLERSLALKHNVNV